MRRNPKNSLNIVEDSTYIYATVLSLKIKSKQEEEWYCIKIGESKNPFTRKNKYGQEFVSSSPYSRTNNKSKQKSQEAHECIRVTNLEVITLNESTKIPYSYLGSINSSCSLLLLSFKFDKINPRI